MGFLGLIPADQLAASYNLQKRQLTLYAKGEVRNFTYGISFDRVSSFVGGLKFELMGWTGPLETPPSTSPYEYEQVFDIYLPSPVMPAGTVVIADENHPDGVVVEIRYLGLPSENGHDTAAPAATTLTADAPAAPAASTVIPSQEQLNVLFKMPFQIKEAAGVPQFGTVSMKFDPAMLELQQAGIEGSNIIWTLNSLQTGNTQVVVTTSGGIAPYIMRKVYDVSVFVLAQEQDQEQDAAANDTQAILSFLGRVNIAVRRVREQYPDAQLYEVEATPPSPQAVTNPNQLSQLRVVFRAGRGTAIIESTGWGTFGPVQYIGKPWLEDRVINWPIKMEATEADTLLKQAGYTGPYGAMTLRAPLSPTTTQPFYIFSMKNGQYVFVGVDDKKVTVERAEMAEVEA